MHAYSSLHRSADLLAESSPGIYLLVKDTGAKSRIGPGENPPMRTVVVFHIL